MNVYGESSAILSWLLGEDRGEAVRKNLARAELVLVSDLTLVECDRVLHRAAFLGDLEESKVAQRREFLHEISATWHHLRLDDWIVGRARRSFPKEPIRTLDALHVASALAARKLVSDLQVLSLDDRVRRCSATLGFVVIPAVLE